MASTALILLLAVVGVNTGNGESYRASPNYWEIAVEYISNLANTLDRYIDPESTVDLSDLVMSVDPTQLLDTESVLNVLDQLTESTDMVARYLELPESFNAQRAMKKMTSPKNLRRIYRAAEDIRQQQRLAIKFGPLTDFLASLFGSGPKFVLWTKGINTTDEAKLDLSNDTILTQSAFNGADPTIIFVAEDGQEADEGWVEDARDALLAVGSHNVIGVDWSCFKANAEGVLSAANATGQLITQLVSAGGASLDKIHLVGFGYGAHVAAMSTQFAGGLPGRITGLDPTRDNTTDPLDSAAATFVDVIHTMAGSPEKPGYAIRAPLGHADFYPNGGKSQPACGPGIFGMIWDLLTKCSHYKAADYFVQSISGEAFLGAPCATPAGCYNGTFEACQDADCAVMGFPATPDQTGTFYVTINSTFSFF